MPRRTIKSKVYKATALKGKAKSVKTAAPALPNDARITPEMQELADFAKPAEEVKVKSSTSNSASKSVSSSKTAKIIATPKQKSKRRALPKLSTKQLKEKVTKPLKMRSLRKSVVKAAKKSGSQKPVSASDAVAKPSTPKSSPKPQELVEGVKIRIREPRRGTAKVAEKIIKENNAALAEAITGAGVKKPKKSVAKKLLKKKESAGPKKSTSPKQPATRKKLLKPLSKSAQKSSRRQRQITRADLINAESKLGSTIFGPVPAGHRREFFHDQQNIWIWHEGWIDENGHARQLTVRYEVRPSGVYKKLSAGKYIKLESAELENFRKATHVYLHTIKRDLYHRA